MSPHEKIEREILQASREGRIPDTLQSHLETCASCGETASVAGFMQKLAGAEKDAPLPDPGILWLKAQLLQNRQIHEQTSHALSLVQRTTWIVIGTCWAAVLAWKWDTVSSWLDDASVSRLIVSSISEGQGISLPFMLLLAGLMGVTALFAAHSVFADE